MRCARYNAQQIVEAGRKPKVNLHPHDRKHMPGGRQFRNEQAPITKILRSGPFKVLQVIGMIDHAGCIGVFIVDSDFHPN